MAIWPFNRKKVDQSLLPDEVTEYYKGGKNTSRGSWILAVSTMLVTAFLAVVLFFGGRWVFQTIFDNNNETSETEQVSDNPVEVTITEPEKDNETEETTTESESAQVNENPQPASNQQDNTPVTGGITEIPNTGPGPNGLQ